MDVSSILAILAAVVSALGLVGVISSAVRQVRARQALRDEMSRHREAVRKLELLMVSLEQTSPDPEKLAEASHIIDSFAENLSDTDRSRILGSLARVSDKSKANYIAKLVEDQERTADGQSSRSRSDGKG